MTYKLSVDYHSRNYQPEAPEYKLACQEAEDALAALIEHSVKNKGKVASSSASGLSASLVVKSEHPDMAKDFLDALKKNLTGSKHFKSISFGIEAVE